VSARTRRREFTLVEFFTDVFYGWSLTVYPTILGGSTTLLENTFDRKHISANPNPNLKHNNVFGITK